MPPAPGKDPKTQTPQERLNELEAMKPQRPFWLFRPFLALADFFARITGADVPTYREKAENYQKEHGAELLRLRCTVGQEKTAPAAETEEAKLDVAKQNVRNYMNAVKQRINEERDAGMDIRESICKAFFGRRMEQYLANPAEKPDPRIVGLLGEGKITELQSIWDRQQNDEDGMIYAGLTGSDLGSRRQIERMSVDELLDKAVKESEVTPTTPQKGDPFLIAVGKHLNGGAPAPKKKAESVLSIDERKMKDAGRIMEKNKERVKTNINLAAKNNRIAPDTLCAAFFIRKLEIYLNDKTQTPDPRLVNEIAGDKFRDLYPLWQGSLEYAGLYSQMDRPISMDQEKLEATSFDGLVDRLMQDRGIELEPVRKGDVFFRGFERMLQERNTPSLRNDPATNIRPPDFSLGELSN